MYEEILAIRKDEYARNRFIEKYKPFLAKYTSSVCGRYVSYSDDDEFLLPEDMIPTIKKLILESWNAEVIRDTNEIPSLNIIK